MPHGQLMAYTQHIMCMYVIFALVLWAYFYQYIRCKTRTLDCLECQCQSLTGTIRFVRLDTVPVTNGLEKSTEPLMGH